MANIFDLIRERDLKEGPDWYKPPAPLPGPEEASLLGEFGKGVLSGVDNLQASLYGLGATGADLLDAPEARDALLEGYNRNTAEAQANAPAVPSYTDIDGPRKGLLYAAAGLGSLVPFAAGSIASGGVGGAAALALRGGAGAVSRAGAARLAASRAGAVAAPEAALAGRAAVQQVAQRGAIAGAAANSIGTETGLIYGDTVNETGEYAPGAALLGGVAAGALDVLPQVGLLNRALGGGKAEGLGKFLLKQTGAEAATEAGQTLIEKAVPSIVGDKPYLTPQLFEETVNAGLIGGLGGFAGGGAARLAGSQQQGDGDALTQALQRAETQRAEFANTRGLPSPRPVVAGFDAGSAPESTFADGQAARLYAAREEEVARRAGAVGSFADARGLPAPAPVAAGFDAQPAPAEGPADRRSGLLYEARAQEEARRSSAFEADAKRNQAARDRQPIEGEATVTRDGFDALAAPPEQRALPPVPPKALPREGIPGEFEVTSRGERIAADPRAAALPAPEPKALPAPPKFDPGPAPANALPEPKTFSVDSQGTARRGVDTKRPIEVTPAGTAITPTERAEIGQPSRDPRFVAPPAAAATAAPAVRIEGVDEIVQNGAGRVRVFNGDREVDFKSFAVSVDGDFAEVGFVQRASNEDADRGSAITAYKQLGEQLASRGITLRSSKTLQAPGKKLWERLVADGTARRVGQQYEYSATATAVPTTATAVTPSAAPAVSVEPAGLTLRLTGEARQLAAVTEGIKNVRTNPQTGVVTVPASARAQIEQRIAALPPRAASPAAVAVQAQQAAVADPKSSEEFVSFPPETETLGIPRAELPQVKAEHRGALVNFLSARAVTHQIEQEIDPQTLKPTQAEFSKVKVEKAREFTGGDRAILVSSDNHIVDGHHQWLAAAVDNKPVKVIRLDAPIRELLPLVRDFPSSTLDPAGASRANQPVGSRVPVPAAAPAARLVAALNRSSPAAGSRALTERDVLDAEPVESDRALAEGVEKAFGKKVAFIRFADSVPESARFDGVYTDAASDTVYLNADTVAPHRLVIFHELFHSLADQNPDLYQALREAALPLIRNQAQYRKEANVEGKEFSAEYVTEEILADLFAENATRQEFWNGIADSVGPSKIKTIARQLSKIIEKLIGTVTGYNVGRYVSDYKKIQSLLQQFTADSIVRAQANGARSPAAGGQTGFGFSRRDGVESGLNTEATNEPQRAESEASRADPAGDRGGREAAGRAPRREVPAPERADTRQEAGQGLSPTSALPGAPNVKGFNGPDPRIVAVAERYARDNGITLRRQAEYASVNPEIASRIAEAYDRMPHAPADPKVAEAYGNLIRQTTAQYQALVDAGYQFYFIDTASAAGQEYSSTPWNALRDMRANQRMGVFSTEEGFGSEESGGAASGNPMEAETGFTWGFGSVDGPKKRVLANDLFRAVHDAFGHGIEGAGFRADGEENAWQAHRRLFTGSAVGAITSETRGQNSWLNYGPYGEKNRTAKVEDTVFAEQKTGLMPEWTWTEGVVADAPESGVAFSRRSSGKKEHPLEIGTRQPGSKKPGENDAAADGEVLLSNFAAAAGREKWIGAVANLVREYPNYRPTPSANTDEKQVERLIRHATDNLVWLHNQVPAETRARSKLWYVGVRKIADRWSKRFGVSDAQIAGTIAALSPQKDWFMNVSLAERVANAITNLQKFRWTPQMEATSARIFGKAQYQEDVDAIRGRSLEELDDDVLRAMWIRVNDEAHSDRSFPILSPEGDVVGPALTQAGSPVKVAWGSVAEIEKAVAIFRDGSLESLSERLGQKYKVRNFYNNILAPESKNGHVTIDTHAVAAALLRPLSSASPEVIQNFGGPSNKPSGLNGVYAVYAEAYRRAGEELGILPREVQSITWEAVRGLFTPGFKAQNTNVEAVDQVWQQYKKGKLSHEAARNRVVELAGGINPPGWSGRDNQAYVEDESSLDPGDVSGNGVPGRDAEDDGRAGSRAAGAVPEGLKGRAQFSRRKADVRVERDGPMYEAKVGNKVVGKAYPWTDSSGDFVIQNVRVSPNFRQRGVATALYSEIERQTGKQLKPAVSLSDDGFEFWKRFRPEAVADDLRHRQAELVGKRAVTRYGVGTIQKASGASALVALDKPAENGGTIASLRRSEIDAAIEAAGDAAAAPGRVAFSRRNPQTQTPEFKRWFRDGALVNENGEPIVLYRGAQGSPEELKAGKEGGLGGGIYLTEDPEFAGQYASKDWLGNEREGGAVSPYYANLQKPLFIEAGGGDPLVKAFVQLGTPQAKAEAKVEKLYDAKGGATSELRAAAQKQGYDGVVLRVGDRLQEVVAFSPFQIKSAIGNSGAFAPGDSRVAFSRRGAVSAAKEQAYRKAGLGAEVDSSTLADRVKAAAQKQTAKFDDKLKARLVEGLFDRFAPIKDAETRAAAAGQPIDAQQSAYLAARLATGSSSTINAALIYGAPQLRDGVVQKKADSKGLLQVLDPVKDSLPAFTAWTVGKRAQSLAAQGRENNLSTADIAELLDEGKGREAEFEAVAKELRAFNDSILELARDTGLLSPLQVEAYRKDKYYLPFFRVKDEEEPTSAFIQKKALQGQTSGIKQLKGGTDALNDPIENLIANTARIIDASVKNEAARRVVENFPTLVTEVTEGAVKDGVVNVSIKGRKVKYKIDDPSLVRAVSNIALEPIAGLGVFRSFKQLLTRTVTSLPTFLANNFARDVLQTQVINRDGYTPVDALKGARATFRSVVDLNKSSPEIEALAFAGASFINGNLYGGSAEEASQALSNALRRKGFNQTKLDTVVSGPKKLLTLYQALSAASENANREATYKLARKKGKTIGQAAFESRDVLDFALQGNYTFIRVLSDVLPFFNARLQGLYKLGRAVKEGPTGVASKGLVLALASVALALSNDDDDRYKALPEWEKDLFWHVFNGEEHFRIPKPFEIGLIFGTVPERAARGLFGDSQTGKDEKAAFGRALWSTLGLNPVPQAVLPIAEAAFNYDTFRQAPIDSRADEGKLPGARYSDYTSLIARSIGEATNISPKRLQHVFEGYLGGVGAMILTTGDVIIRRARGEISPAWEAQDVPVLGSFYRSGEPRSTRYAEDLYELAGQADEVYKTIRAFREEGRTEDAAELQAENVGLLKARAGLADSRKQLGALRKQAQAIRRDQTITSEVKLERLKSIRTRINALSLEGVERAQDRIEAAG